MQGEPASRSVVAGTGTSSTLIWTIEDGDDLGWLLDFNCR